MSRHYLYSAEGKNLLLREYIEAGRPTREIAHRLGTYHVLIQRALKYHNIPIRDRSEAQLTALYLDRSSHPTKGKIRPDSTRTQISSKLKARKDVNGTSAI